MHHGATTLSALTLQSACAMVSIVIPTRNENENLDNLTERISAALEQHPEWELIFVDDSDDDTTQHIETLAERLPISLIHRVGSDRAGGLGSAVLRGIASARGDVVVVMDADLQHPPELIPRMATAVVLDFADVVIASRFAAGASAAGLSGPWRHLATGATRHATHLAIRRTRQIQDPLSGFFSVRASILQTAPRRSAGFKVLLDILAESPWHTALEVPFTIAPRHAGRSKAGPREASQFLVQLARLTLLARPAYSAPHNTGQPRELRPAPNPESSHRRDTVTWL